MVIAGPELGIYRLQVPRPEHSVTLPPPNIRLYYWDCESMQVPYFKPLSLFLRERKLCINIRLHFSLFDLVVAESARNGRDEKVMAGEARRTGVY